MSEGELSDSTDGFEDGKALARLLAEEVIFPSSHWWEKDWPDRARKVVSLNVNCSDIFTWACADAEEVEYGEIQGLYDMYLADRTWGAAKWCAIKRGQRPQPPVIEAMKKVGSWDARMEALGVPNAKVTGSPVLSASPRGLPG